MNDPTRRKRLDEILIEKGYVTEAQIREALLSQKLRGGKFGSHLLQHKFVDEARLVEALSMQMGCEGVALSSREIPAEVVGRIPKEFAIARKVMPFEYSAEGNVLRVACEDPADESLAREIGFIAPGTRLEMCVTTQTTLDAAIRRHYLGGGVPMAEAPALTVLLVTDDEGEASELRTLLESCRYKVATIDVAEDITDRLESQACHAVLVKDSLAGSKADLVARIRRVSPTTTVRYFKNGASLLLDNAPPAESELFLRNLDVLTSLLACKAKMPTCRAGRVAQYAEGLCRKLKLPEGDRLIITNAAYLEDVASAYYGPDKIKDTDQGVQLSVRLLESLDYPQAVLEVLRSVHAEVDHEDSLHLPIGVLGGNILAAVDVLCREVPEGSYLSLDKFDAVRASLREQAGRTLLREVAEGLIEMLQERVLDCRTTQTAAQVMVYCEDADRRQRMEARLRAEGFRTVAASSLHALAELYERSEPDLLLLAAAGSIARVLSFLDEISDAGVSYQKTPTLLAADGPALASIASLLGRGLQDVMMLEDNLDLMVRKMRRVSARMISEGGDSEAGTDSASRGRLADMNLVDLLQALGPGRKTAKIVIRPGRSQSNCLTLYLEEGRIVFAETEDRNGPAAVLEALSWVDGTWNVESTAPDAIPERNNSRPNESIIMEWCRLQDEAAGAACHQ